MAVKTSGELKQLFETGDRPDGQAFADLIDSLRHISATVPAADITGLATLIENAVAAATGGGEDADLSVIVGADSITIREGAGAAAILPLADSVNPGLMSAALFRKLRDIPVDGSTGAGPTTSIRRVVTLNVAGSLSWPASATKLLSGFIITPSATSELRIGTSAGGSDLYVSDATSGVIEFADIVKYTGASDTLHFTGNFQVKFTEDDYASTEQALATVNVNGSTTYSASAVSLLRDFVLIPSSIGTMKIGTSPDASDILQLEAESSAVVFADVAKFLSAATTIHFTGQFQAKFKVEDYA